MMLSINASKRYSMQASRNEISSAILQRSQRFHFQPHQTNTSMLVRCLNFSRKNIP